MICYLKRTLDADTIPAFICINLRMNTVINISGESCKDQVPLYVSGQ